MKSFKCFHCNKLGHGKSQCWWLKKSTEKADVVKQDKTVGFVRVIKESPREAKEVQTIVQPVQEVIVKTVPDVFKEFSCVGKVYSCVSGGAGEEVTILSDKGASQSLMLRDEEICSLGRMLPEKVVICGIQGERRSVPLYKVRLESPVKSGEVVVGVIDKLSCPGIQFILGNDIAGSQVGVIPTVVDKPVENQSTEVLQDEYPGICPDCVVTRSQSHRLRQEEKSRGEDEVEVQLSATIFDQMVEKEQEQVEDEADIFRSGILAELQQKDIEIKRIYQKAYTEEESESIPECYYRKNDVLMRKWRPVHMQGLFSTGLNRWL
ncbi:uncharacterized protein [Scyliorhinus torazame]|uniref:uncharacterized protein n=1 Tax=Scyliorhinus torazame TaxID=75743 RepID=UPI003B59F45E